MAQQTINVGTVANDGTGDKLNLAMSKINNNFDDLYENKEPSIDFGSPSQYFNGNKEWKNLDLTAVTGLQSALDSKYPRAVSPALD